MIDRRPAHVEPTRGFEAALARIAEDASTAIADLARMIAVDTSFPPGAGYVAFADLMEELTRPLGFTCRRVLVPQALWQGSGDRVYGDRVNLIAERRAGKPVCGLYYHVDTVPPAADWRRPPFTLSPEGSRLYGLGAADMKGAIAATLLALRAAAVSGIALAYDPVLLFCTDEEGGLYPGIRYLAERGLLGGHIVNFNGGAVPRIWAGCFGSFNLAIRLKGRAAHAGDPKGGLNAIEAAQPLLNALHALKPRVAKRLSALPPPPHFEGRQLAAQLAITAAHGGASGSTLPALFEILVNRRYPPEETFEEALSELEATICNATDGSGLAVETEIVGHLVPVSDPTGPHWPRWQAALSRGFGFAPETFRPWGAVSASDFGWVQRLGMQEFLLGGLIRADRNIHAAEEHTTVEDLVALAQSILAYLAADFAPEILPEAALPAAPRNAS